MQWAKQLCRMTQREYQVLTVLKKRLRRNGSGLKRGEILRLGLAALASMSDAELRDFASQTALPRQGT